VVELSREVEVGDASQFNRFLPVDDQLRGGHVNAPLSRHLVDDQLHLSGGLTGDEPRLRSRRPAQPQHPGSGPKVDVVIHGSPALSGVYPVPTASGADDVRAVGRLSRTNERFVRRHLICAWRAQVGVGARAQPNDEVLVRDGRRVDVVVALPAHDGETVVAGSAGHADRVVTRQGIDLHGLRDHDHVIPRRAPDGLTRGVLDRRLLAVARRCRSRGTRGVSDRRDSESGRDGDERAGQS
jgi:hypothetical protein